MDIFKKFFTIFGLVFVALPASAAVELVNPIEVDKITDIPGVIIGNFFLNIIGSIALLMLVIGGFIWLTSAGNPEKVKKGKDVIIWTIVGLVIFFGAYTIISFIFSALPINPAHPAVSP